MKEAIIQDILCALMVTRSRAEVMANEIEQADHQAAKVLRKFSQELSTVWERYYPLLPTNADLYRLRNSSKNEAKTYPSEETAS